MTFEEEKNLIASMTKNLSGSFLKHGFKGQCIIAVQCGNRPGSFKGGEKSVMVEHFQEPMVEGSFIDRLAMISAILRDVPTAYYPVIRESILIDERERTQWELINEPSGVTAVKEEEEVTEAEIIAPQDGIFQKVGKAFFRGLHDEG